MLTRSSQRIFNPMRYTVNLTVQPTIYAPGYSGPQVALSTYDLLRIITTTQILGFSRDSVQFCPVILGQKLCKLMRGDS